MSDTEKEYDDSLIYLGEHGQCSESSEDRELSEDESEEIQQRISEAEFRNKATHYVPEVERISKAQYRNKKTPSNNGVEKTSSKPKFLEDKLRGKRLSEDQFRNKKKRRNLSEKSAVLKTTSKAKAKEFVFERISKSEFRNKKTHYGNNKVETTSTVRKPGFGNRHIKKENQIKSEAECSKRHHRLAETGGREYQHDEMNESEDSDEIKIIESSSSARARIQKGKQPAYNDTKTESIGRTSSGTSKKLLKRNNRRSELRSPRSRLTSGVVAEKPSKLVIEITSDSSSSDSGLISDSKSSEYEDDSDDSLYESEEKSESKEVVISSSAESDEEDYIPEEKSEEDHSKHLMEFLDSNNDDQESVQQQKRHLPSSHVSLDASSKVNETEIRDNIQENNERAKHVQESVTKRVKEKRKDEREFHSEDRHPKRLKKVVSSMSNETGKRMELNREEEEDKAKECINEAIRKGKKKVDVEEDSDMHQKSTSSTPIKEHSRREEMNTELEETEQPITKRHDGVHVRADDQFCKNILDSVLGENDDDKNHKEANQSFSRLPSKFRFEDEVPKPVEKSEYEIMTDNLFDELNFCLTLEGETGPSASQEVDKDNNVQDSSSDDDDYETQQAAMCRKGKHYLIEDDEQGLICIYCLHVAIAAKDILPSWAEKTYRRVERPRISSNTEQRKVKKNGLIFLPGERESSITSNFNLGGNGTTVWDEVKHSIQRTMFEHQREGFEFLWRNIAGTTQLSEITSTGGGGCIISHAPGTGKTRLTIVFMETYLRRFPNCRPLIIAPASMLLTWEEEFKRWEVEFPFLNLNSPDIANRELKMALQHIPREKNQKRHAIRTIKIYSWNKGKSILGMSYDLFVRLVGDNKIKRNINVAEKEPNHDFMRTILLEKPGLVVLDEGHIPRNQGSNNWQAISKLKTEKRIILSGTPFQNNFEELFNVLQVVRPSITKEERFKEIFASKRQLYEKKRRRQSNNIVVEENVDNCIKELKTAMAPFVHVHKGTILLESLPGLMECVVLLKPLPLQKSLIEKIERSQNIFTVDSKVAHISTHPYLFKKCEQLTEKEKSGVDESALEESRLNPNEGVKTRFIMEIVRISLSRKEKVLIFSQYLEPLSFIKEHLEKTFDWAEAKQILMIKGGLEQKHRQNFISSFNDPNSEAKVLLASTRCCSEGIHLVGASRVVLLDVVWNHAVERQAICRAYRLRQKKVVYTYHLMAMGTREQNKFQQQAKKAHLSELVFTSSSNEKCSKAKNLDAGIIDGVLEHMVADEKLKDLFDKVIYQPKEKNLIESFGLEN